MHVWLLIVALAFTDSDGAGADDNIDDAWCSASSQHFILYTEGGAKLARRTLEDAEAAYHALGTALGLNMTVPDNPRPLTLVLFSSRSMCTQVAGRRSAGFFRPALGWGERDMIVICGAGMSATLRHELTHRLMHALVPKAPPWLNEGLAQYYQWSEIDPHYVHIGATEETLRLQRSVHEPSYFPPLATLFAARPPEFYGVRAPGLYSASFWLVSTLNADPARRAQLNELLRLLASGTGADWAWAKTFSPTDTVKLADEYRAAPTRPDPVAFVVPWHATIAPPSPPRRLSAGEAHVVRAKAFTRSLAYNARRELDEALALDPNNAEAYARRALLAPRPSRLQLDDAERAVALDPRPALHWQALALALRGGPRLREVAHKLEALGDMESHLSAACAYAAAGEPERGYRLARAESERAPPSFLTQVVVAKLAAQSGRDDESKTALGRAWTLAPDGVDPEEVESFLERNDDDASGAITLNAGEPPSEPYPVLKALILQHWQPRMDVRALTQVERDRERSLVTVFKVDGGAAEMVRSSGVSDLDVAAALALKKSLPLPGVTRLVVRFEAPLGPPP